MSTEFQDLAPIGFLEGIDRVFRILVGITLLVTFASSTGTILTGIVGNVVSLGLILSVLLLYVVTYRQFTFPYMPVLSLFIIYCIFTINSIRTFTGVPGFRTAVPRPVTMFDILLHTGDLIGYILASFTFIFVIPHVYNRLDFYRFVALFSAGCVLLGIPAYLIGDYSILSINIDTYTSVEPLRQMGIHIPALASVWDDANAMSKIALAGLFGSHFLYLRHRSAYTTSLLLINGLGLFLANSKMAILGLLIAYTVYFVYIRYGRFAATVYLGCSAVAGLLMFLLFVKGFGQDSIVPMIGFGNRVQLWQGSVETASRQLILGSGIHQVGQTIAATANVDPLAPQNSYLRLLVATGILGAASYGMVIAFTTIRHVQTISSQMDLVTFCLFLSFIIVQFTDTADPFGVNKNSVIFGIVLGYLLKDIYFDTVSGTRQ